jgi:hypothetical protein
MFPLLEFTAYTKVSIVTESAAPEVGQTSGAPRRVTADLL